LDFGCLLGYSFASLFRIAGLSRSHFARKANPLSQRTHRRGRMRMRRDASGEFSGGSSTGLKTPAAVGLLFLDDGNIGVRDFAWCKNISDFIAAF
jgi:hypothetical protein